MTHPNTQTHTHVNEKLYLRVKAKVRSCYHCTQRVTYKGTRDDDTFEPCGVFREIVLFYLLVWAHTTRLTPPPFIKVSVPSQESERSCICMLGVSILSLFFSILY